MPIELQKLDHFAIYVTELARSEQFYREHFGMPVHARIGSEQILMKCGDTLLALFVKPDLQTPIEPGGVSSPLGRAHFAVNVSAEDWHAARAQMGAAGIPMSEPIDWGDHHCFYVADPDGNLVELMTWRARGNE